MYAGNVRGAGLPDGCSRKLNYRTMVWWGFYAVAVEPASWWWTIIEPLLKSFP